MHNNSLFYRILLDDFGIGGVPATVTEGGNEDFEVGDLQLKMYKLIKTNKCTSVKAVGDPGDDHECPLGCEESMPRSRLWPHVVRELDAFCSAAEPDVEHARNVKCVPTPPEIGSCGIRPTWLVEISFSIPGAPYARSTSTTSRETTTQQIWRSSASTIETTTGLRLGSFLFAQSLSTPPSFYNHRRLKKHIFNTTGHKVDETVDEPDNSDDDNPHLPPVKRMRTADLPAKRPGPKSSKKNKRSETTSSETPGGVVVPKLRLNLAASLSKTSSPAVQGELVTELIGSLMLGNVCIFVQLIFCPRWPMNQLNKNPNIA